MWSRSLTGGLRGAVTRLGIVALLVCASIALIQPGHSRAEIFAASISTTGGPFPGASTLHLLGGVESDSITIRKVPGVADPTKTFIEVEDLEGIREVPKECFRKDANTIHCPVELVQALFINLDLGNDGVKNLTDVPSAVFGGGGIDVIDGAGNDILNGGPGNDKLFGQAGNDKLLGGPGNDRIFGGPGKDIVDCGPGKHDVGVGGPGKDLGRRCETVRH